MLMGLLFIIGWLATLGVIICTFDLIKSIWDTWERYDNKKRLIAMFVCAFIASICLYGIIKEDRAEKKIWNQYVTEHYCCLLAEDNGHKVFLCKENGVDKYIIK